MPILLFNITVYFGAYFTEQNVLYFTLAKSFTFYAGAYFTEQYFTRFYTYFLIISTIHIFKQYVVLYFILAFSITFYVGAYFTEQYFTRFYTYFFINFYYSHFNADT